MDLSCFVCLVARFFQSFGRCLMSELEMMACFGLDGSHLLSEPVRFRVSIELYASIWAP